MRHLKTRWVSGLILLLILAVGGYFRFLGLNWDQNTHLHPDERFITMVETSLSPVATFAEYFDTHRSSLNPHNRGHHSYVYGTLPLFAVRYAAGWLGRTGYDQVHLVGRAASAGVDLLTVVLAYLIAARLFDRRVGLLAAAFLALAVLPIQLSHYFAVDTFMNFFVFLAIYFAVLIATSPDRRRIVLWSLAFAAAAGMAMASKLSAAPVVLMLPAAFVVRGRGWRDLPFAAGNSILAAVVFLAVFRVGQPYAFAGPGFFDVNLNPKWVDNLRSLHSLMSNPFSWPPGLQWADRPVWFAGENLVRWGLGWPLGILSGAGFLWMGWRCWRGEWRTYAMLWGWTAVYFTWQSLGPTPMMRYLLPVYPALAIIAAWAVFELGWGARRSASPSETGQSRGLRVAVAGVVGVAVLAGTFLWAWGFSRIYTRPLTRIAASRWIFENIPLGSALAKETNWDDSLPMRIDGKDPFGRMYRGDLNLEIYGPDTREKVNRILDVLDRADYILISSNRQWGTVPRLPYRHPASRAFYRHLLGCPPGADILWCYGVAEPGRFTGLLGFDLVATFQSDPQIGPWRINDQLADESFTVYDHPKVLIFKKRSDYSPIRARIILGNIDLSQVRDNPNDLMLPRDRREIQQAGGTWREIFNSESVANRYPAVGVMVWYVSVMLLGWLVYPVVRRVLPGLADHGYPLARTAGLLFLAWPVWLLGSAGVPFSRMTIGGVLAGLAAVSFACHWAGRRESRAPWRERVGYFLTVEALFLAFFLLDLAIRGGNPDLWHPFKGGEKPMDFSYFNAVLKSTTFPPYDPWFAGGFINYYYYGFVFVGVLVKFLGLVPAFAYNLVLPTLFAMTAMGGFSVAWNLMEGETHRRRVWIGLAAAAGLVILGNLGTLQMILQGVHQWRYGSDWYWVPSRIIPVRPGEVQPITEFPFFTFLYADLHAHMMALPMTLLALAWGVGIVKSRRWLSRWGLLASLVGGAVVIGALRVTNTWDFPVYLGLGVLALAVCVPDYRRKIAACILLVLLAVLFYRPFDLWYGWGYTGAGLWTGGRTPWTAYLWHWGLFLFVIGSWLVWEVWRLVRGRGTGWTDSRWMVLVLVVVAVAIAAMVEFVVLRGDIGRMNTVFKFYLQAWTLLAVSAAAALGFLRARRWPWWCGVALLAEAAALFPVVGGYQKVVDRMAPTAPATLDGMAFMRYASHGEQGTTMNLAEDYRAIRWLQENVKGSPVIVEANTPGYRWGSRMTVYTGLPGVVGWDWHQRQQRACIPGERITERINQVHEFYRTTDVQKAKDFLRKYHVKYIIVGQLERAYYPGPGLDKFERNWKAVYRDGNTVIYEVTE